MVAEPALAMAKESSQQSLPYEISPADYEQKRADMSCSLDNPDACEACGS
jgi:ribonucleoside-diphosphate reductase alpha chain